MIGLLTPYPRGLQVLSRIPEPNPVPGSVGKKGPDTLWARRVHGPHLPTRVWVGGKRGLCFLFWVPSGAWNQILAKTPPFYAEFLVPYLEHPKSVSGESLSLLLSLPQNFQKESTAEAPNPRPEDAQQSQLDQSLGRATQFPSIQD